MTVDDRGTIFAAATSCNCVVKVTPEGRVRPILSAELPWSPTGVAVQGADLYVLEYTNANGGPANGWAPRVRKLARDGKVSTLATVSPRSQP